MGASIRSATDVHVTGATGYLGSELLRLRPGASGERVEIRDAGATRALFERLRPGTVIHTAYRQEDASVNVEGSENVALAAATVGARLLHLSTDVVFDGRKGAPYVEDDPVSPVTAYGLAKAEAEKRVAAAHPETLIVRTSLIVGGAQPSAQPSKHELAASGPGPWFTNEIRSPIQVTDLAQALLELAELDVAGPLHVAGADGVSRAELAELIAGRPVPTAEAPPARPLDCRLDSSRAQALLHTRLRGVRELFGREG
jgi:dTDP-4-dehydrorhamnose reductase